VAPGLKRSFLDAGACARCHSGYHPVDLGGPEPAPLVRLDELKTWAERDKHRRAFDALTGPRGQAMGELLRYKDVRSEPACLSCHATGFLPADPRDEQDDALAYREQGVGCVACHGSYQEWVGEHSLRSRRWRRRPAEEKARDFGMTDLRDPAARAGVCASCHVGNADEGKVVTHAMYAAGHPPLPPFEVATFLDAMPPHWWKPGEVEAFRVDPALAARNHAEAGEPYATRAAVVGGLVTLREAMRLLAARSEPEPTPLGRSGRTWPDYAQLDCAACHHDLRAPGWRQARGSEHRFDGLAFVGVPGRPQFRPWTLAAVRPALALTGGAERVALGGAVRDLYAAFDATPFGDPAEVSRAARRLEAWSESMLRAVESARFDASTPPRVLVALAATPADEVLDYDSARQVARALGAVYGDWTPRPANGAQIAEGLAGLDRLLKLDPDASGARRAGLITARGLSGDRLRDALQRLNQEDIETSLARASDYDPDAFRAALGHLADLAREAAAPAQGRQGN
jgi:hypothetical protein